MKGLEGTLELYVDSERGAGFADDNLLSVLLYSLPLCLPCYASTHISWALPLAIVATPATTASATSSNSPHPSYSLPTSP